MTEVSGFSPVAGRPYRLADDLTLVLAPNPSPMTYLGTNTFILGRKTRAIIDPGPDDPAHLQALTAAIAGDPVSHIFVTHSHLDHSPLARQLAASFAAPVFAFGPSHAGRSEIMRQLAQSGLAGGGEGIDLDFQPDHCLVDGQTIQGDWGQITAIHTPGHIGNHLCFQWQDTIFTGDHVMGWASSLVSPPDGDLTDFMQSCAKLQTYAAHRFYPAHGAPVDAPRLRLEDLIAHRKARETQILQALTNGPMTPQAITKVVYQDTPPALRPAAQRNVFAHLVDLRQRGYVIAPDLLSANSIFALRPVK